MKKKKILILENIENSGVRILKRKFDVKISLNLSRKEIINRIKNYDVVIIKSTIKIDNELLENSKKLQVIARAGTGLDNIDLKQLKKNKIKLIYTPNLSSESVADFTLMMILIGIRNFIPAIDKVKKYDFRRNLLIGKNISEVTVGIIGQGRIGKIVAKRLKFLGVKLYILDPKIKNGITLNKILKKCDIITFHVPLLKNTKNLITKEKVNKMKDNVILINTSRANIFKKNFYKTKKKFTFFTDVIDPEPSYNTNLNKSYKHEWLRQKNFIFTPHIASMTNKTQKDISEKLAKKIINHFFKIK